MASPTYNDGTVQYGSRVLTVLDASSVTYGTYVADNITINRPTKAVDRTNEIGEPSGSVGIADFVTGSATIQLASSSTKEPIAGYTVTMTLDSTIGSETFFITSINRAESKDAEKKFNITLKKKYN